MLFAHSTNHSRGVLILFNSELQFEIKNQHIDTEGRYILVEATIQDSPFLLVNLCAPTKSREQCKFFEDIKSALDELEVNPDCEIIIGGNFNTHLNPTLDNLGGGIETKPSVRKIEELMMAYDLIDIWRIHHPDKKSFTWTQKKPFIRRRLDYWLISSATQDDVSKTEIIPAIKSDHSAVTLLLNSLDKQPHGPSYWRFNSSLLEDSSYVERISLKYSEWLDEFKEVADKRVLWDLVKYRIRSFTIKYSKEKAKERRARLAEAEKKVKRCELICDNDPSPNNVNDLEAAKHEYDLLHDYIVRGCIVRSRINWYENGEKNSKYFLNLEKTRRGKTAVRRLYDSAGKITVNPKFIINELRDYYQELYSNHDFEEGEEFASDF